MSSPAPSWKKKRSVLYYNDKSNTQNLTQQRKTVHAHWIRRAGTAPLHRIPHGGAERGPFRRPVAPPRPAHLGGSGPPEGPAGSTGRHRAGGSADPFPGGQQCLCPAAAGGAGLWPAAAAHRDAAESLHRPGCPAGHRRGPDGAVRRQQRRLEAGGLSGRGLRPHTGRPCLRCGLRRCINEKAEKRSGPHRRRARCGHPVRGGGADRFCL